MKRHPGLRQKGAKGLKRSVFLFWLGSSLVILCIPIMITLAVLLRSQHLLNSEVIRSNEALLIQVKQSMDDQVRNMKKMGLQLSLEPKVLRYLEKKDYGSPEFKLETLDLIPTLQAYAASNGDITDFYIYLKQPGLGVSTSSMAEADILYRNFYSGKDMTEAAWRALMEKNYPGVMESMVAGDLSYIQSLPLQEMNQAPATLVVLLNTDSLKSAISSIQLAQSGSVAIVDAQSRPVMWVGERIPAAGMDFQGLEGELGTVVDKQNTISYVSSEEHDWKYVSIVPTKIYSAKVSQLQNWIYVSMALSLAIGGCLSYWLTRRNYLPIRRMVDTVSPRVKANLHEIKNEFTLLDRFMSEHQQNLDVAEKTIRQQNEALSKHFLARLLKGRVERGVALAQSLESFGYRFAGSHFAVLLFHIGSYQGLFHPDQDMDEESRLQFVHLIVSNISEELLAQEHTVYSAEVDGMAAFLVNLDGEEELETLEGLLEKAKEAQEIIQNKFLIQLTIGVSNIHLSQTSIPQCYEEALEALSYKFVIGQSLIIPYERIRISKNELFYPLDMERQLINHIKTGQYEEAMMAVSTLISTNLSGGILSLQSGKLLMFELIGTMLKATEHIEPQENGLDQEKSELISRLLGGETFAEMENMIYQFLRTVCDFIDARKRSHNTGLKEQILDYIEEHLADMNLSLGALSLEFNLNGPYLSRFFKEQTGETFIDYVNLQRVRLAKRLLTETSETINDITEKVGFTNSNTFIRVFKRYEGITPGQYRKGE